MTKRILSIMLVLAMLIAVLPIPAAVSAEPAGQTKHTHTDAHTCSEQCSGNVTWQAWGVTGGNATSLPTASGHYYLECDITLSTWAEVTAGLDITICLNGYNITETASASGNQRVHGKLTISDCTAYYDAEGNYISGAVTGCKQGDGAFMNVRRGGTLVLESGKITGCTATGGGGAVSLQSSNTSLAGGIFHMYGGEITGNTAMNGGGIVANNGGSVYIHGGRIYGNTATGNGRAIYISGAASKLVVSGSPYIDQVYFDNASNVGLQVAGLSGHAKITVNTKTADATVDKVIKLAGTQETWDCHWVSINNQSVDRTDSGFVFGHSHNGIAYTRRVNSMPEGVHLDKMNYYYLTQDIVLPADRAAHVLRTPVTICLNGYTITQQNPAAPVYEITGSLTLEDGWAHTDENGIYQAGGVTLKEGVTSTSNTGSAFYVNGGSLTLNAGKLYGFTGSGADYGSPIYVTNSGSVTVNGGMICENTATKSRGGAIFARGGKVTVTGGTICHNAAPNNQGGAIILREGSTLTMQGGVIEHNSAKADGGGIYCHNSTANITGGTIRHNTSAASGGGIGFGSAAKGTVSGLTVTGNSAPNGAGVLVQGSSQVTVTDSTVTGNSGKVGGGIYLTGTTALTLTNTTVTGNTASSKAGGIYWDNKDAKLTLTGSTQVNSNTANGAAQNLFMNNASQMLVVNNLTGSQTIGLSNRSGFASQELTADYSGSFFCDDGENVVAFKENKLYIFNGHEHCQDGKTDCGHTQEGWTKWTSTNSLPTGAGNYFLANDVELTGRWDVSSDIKLCLNGHTVKQTKAGQRIIRVGSGTLTVTDCQNGGKLTGGTATADGGGIRVEGENAKLVMYNVTLSGNTTTGHGGGIFVVSNAQAELYNVTVSDNKAEGSTGGGIALREGGKLTMVGGTVSGNYSKLDGAGLYAHKDSVVTITDTVFSGNTADGAGAVGFSNTAKATLTGLQIMDNKALNAGGMVVQGSSQVTVTGSTLSGNSSKVGGGIYLTGTTTLTLTDTVITGNTASSKAGGIYWDNADSQLTVGGATQITGNTANGAAQNLFMNKASQMLAVTDLTGSQTIGLSNRSGFVSKELAADYSGSFFCDDGETQVTFKENKLYITTGHTHCADGKTDCEHEKEDWTKWTSTNSLPTGAGNYFLANDVELTNRWDVSSDIKLCLNGHTITQTKEGQRVLKVGKGTLTITDCQEGGKLTGGTATADGGGIRVEGENAKLVMYNVTLSGNTTTGHGGGIFVVAKAQAELYNVTVSDNKAEGSTGGGITLREGGKLTMVGGTVSGNYSKLDGAGLYGHKDSVTTITDTVFTGNTATGAGGGIGFGNTAVATITGAKVTGNTALNGGGVIVQGTAEVTMDGCSVEHNKATNTKDLGGGGIFVSSKLTLKNSTVKENEAPVSGAGIYATGAILVLEGGSVCDNISTGSGAGICATAKTQLTMQNVTVSGNETQSQGGGMLVNKESTATLSGVTVENNASQKDGGGIYAHTVQITVENAQITGNKSAASAGGIGFGGSCTGSLKNTKITGNEAPNGGGMIVQGTSQITAEAVTVQGNTATLGGGVFVNKGAALTVTGGSEFSGNKAEKQGGAVYVAGGAAVILSDCTLQTNEGYGVYVCDQALVTLQDAPVIRANVGGNLYLAKDVAITVGKLTDGASVSVTANPGQFSQPCEDLAIYFTSDSGYRKVAYVDGALHLVSADNYAHNHCVCGGSLDSCKHEKVEWNVWEKTDSLPTSGCYYLISDVVLTGEVSISQDLMLCLNGHTVKAAENKRILSTPKNVEVTITITDCTAQTTKDGGYVAGALTGGVDVAKETGGGAIFTRAGATLNLYGGKITGNKSVTAGGAILVAADATFNMYGGEISRNGNANEDDPIDGGAIYAISGAKINLYGGTLSENSGEDGGAIFISGGCTFTMEGGKIEKNSASAQGGGVYCHGSTAAISGGTIRNNKAAACAGGIGFGRASQAVISGGEITGNTSPNGGGVLIQGTTVLKLEGGSITGNTSTGYGGGIYVNSGSTLTMTGGSVSENTSVRNGAGIYAIKATGKLTGGTIENNSAKRDGGGICVSGGTMELGGEVKITGNQTTGAGGGVNFTGKSTGTISGGTIQNNKSINGGGVIIQGSAVVQITGGTIKGNTANSSGGGIYVNNSTLKLSGGTVTGNQAVKGQGGGMLSYNSDATVTGGSFTYNQSKSDGGGIYAKKGTIRLSGMYIANNTNKGSGGGAGASQKATMILSGGTIENNTSINGAGIIIQGQAHLDMYGGTVQNNEASDTAGGIYIHKSSGNLLGGTFQGNTAEKNGGGGYFWRSTVKMDSVGFKDNRAKTGGGGFYCYWTEADLSNILVAGNYCESSGGGMVFSHLATLNLKDSVVENNKATVAAGILIQSWSDGVISDTTVRGNEAYDGWGGGIGQYNVTDVDYIDCDIYENSATNQGGGVYVRSNRGANTPLAYADFTNVKIHDNVSKLNGGGICAVQQVIYTMTDCQIYNNEATETGGGLAHRDGANGTFKNLTVTGNKSGKTGAGIWISDSTNFDGLTVTGNKTAEGSAVYYAPSGFDGQSYVLGLHKLSGNVRVCDNEGTMDDLFIGEDTVIGVMPQGFGADTKIQVQLAGGILTNTLLGEYDYEGGDLHYTVTAGSRSLTEPEVFVPVEEPETAPTDGTEVTNTDPETPAAETEDNTVLYAGIGGIAAVIVLAAVIVILVKKKKTGNTTGATKE